MTSSIDSANDVVNSTLLSETRLQRRYRIVRQLGKGGMGAVYEAVDERLGITVALKEVLSAEPSMRKQFQHEARLLASTQHPALPRVTDHFVEGNRAFLVMQFISGIDLGRIIGKQPGPFPHDLVIAWADQLLDALNYLHSRERQIIHRDIKPHNLKLTSTGQIALLDFGLAKAQNGDSSLTSSRAFFGYTKHYAPLEQIQDERTDPRSDIYALGATLYHLLTGTKPPDALARASALLNGEPDPLQLANQIHPIVGLEISTILHKAMALKSEERFATAAEFREALQRLGRETSTPPVARVVVDDSTNTEFTKAARPAAASLNLAMVASERRFGPGALTAVVLLIGTVAAGVLYGAPSWLDAVEPSSAQSSVPASTASASKSVRPAAQSNTQLKTRNQTEPTAAIREIRTEPRPTQQRVIQEAGGNIRIRRKVGAPNIHLPEPAVAEPTAGIRPQTRPDKTTAPQSFRTADGSHIVRFSDGTTRVIRLGAKSGQ